MLSRPELLDFMREKAYKPMNVEELKETLAISDADELLDMVQMLNKMEDDGVIVRNRAHRYGVPERMNLVVGRLEIKSKGFGFVIPDDPAQASSDVFVNPGDLNGAMNGDRVVSRISGRGNGPRIEGAVIRVLKRAVRTVVGTFMPQGQQYAFVQPDDPRIRTEIFITQDHFGEAKEGQKVVVEITQYPEDWRSAAQGKITEVIGYPDEPGVDILSIIRKHGLPEAFPEDVIQEANDIPDTITEEDMAGRRDLRERRMVTIDGEDAKDLDDAVSIERLPNGNYLLGVHIADVGYYVREGEPLDREANERGTSVYLVDRVIPMLPQRLSNGICSLNPQVDRLTLTCDMEWTPDAELVNHEIYPSIIKTNERMTYTNVRKILVDQDAELMERYDYLVDDFKMLEELAMKLRARRFRRGAIDFDFDETKIIVDETGKPIEVRKRERTIAEMIIEECMLAANETVAEHFHWLEVPFLYRVHEQPDGLKISNFAEFVQTFGFRLKGIGNVIHPRSLQVLLEQIKGTPEENIISTVMLRSLKQARYWDEPLGHFGLAAEYYSHFTSPIRRYPDLVIHRIIREVIDNGNRLPAHRQDFLRSQMQDIAVHSSERERLAVDAERETDNLKKVEFMEDKVGQEFEGLISGVTSFGIFVTLENSIEGMAHISYLEDDYYHLDEKNYLLIGERTGRLFRMGDRVKIRVESVSKENRTIDFRILEGGTVRGREYVKQMRAERAARDRTDRKKGSTSSKRSASRGGSRVAKAGRAGKAVAVGAVGIPAGEDASKKKKTRRSKKSKRGTALGIARSTVDTH